MNSKNWDRFFYEWHTILQQMGFRPGLLDWRANDVSTELINFRIKTTHFLSNKPFSKIQFLLLENRNEAEICTAIFSGEQHDLLHWYSLSFPSRQLVGFVSNNCKACLITFVRQHNIIKIVLCFFRELNSHYLPLIFVIFCLDIVN